MPMTVWFAINDDEDIEISRNDVNETSDIKELQEWYEAVTASIIDLVYQGKAHKECGVSDQQLAFKLGRQRQAQDWIYRRLDTLNSLPPRQQSKLEEMQAERDVLKSQLENLKNRMRKAAVILTE